jgi:soluble lytic murein transglycosylase-like protein
VDVPADTIVRYEPEEIFARAIVPVAEVELTVPFAELIRAAAKKYDLDAQLLARVVQAESNFNPRAISTKNAQGLMQIIPSTASRMALRNPFDPAQSIDAGAHYLRQMLDKFSGNVELALAAYNAGPDRVVQYHGVPPYRETRNYVRKITKPTPQKPAKSAPKSPSTASASIIQ